MVDDTIKVYDAFGAVRQLRSRAETEKVRVASSVLPDNAATADKQLAKNVLLMQIRDKINDWVGI